MAKRDGKPGVAEDASKFVGAPIRRSPDVILEAKPLQGEVDFRAMRKRIAAKFPKTLAKLAE